MANPYLDALQAAPLATGGTPGNPYLDMLEGAEDVRRTQMAGSMMQAVQVNPDQYATQKRIAGQLGYPVAAVEAMPDLAKQQAQVQSLQQATEGRPVLARMYTDADFAKLAHDDHSALSAVSDHITNAFKYVFSAGDGNTLMGDLGAGVYAGNAGFSGAFQAGSELAAPLFDFLEATTPQEQVGWRGAIGGNPLRRLAEGFATNARESSAKADQLSPPQAGLMGGVSSGVRSVAQNALTLPLALLPGGQPAAVSGLMAAVTGGEAFQQVRT